MKQPGFSILEFVISIMISSFLMTASLLIYQQISKSAYMVQKTIDHDTTIMIIRERLSKDLLGICPLWFTQENSNTKSEQQPTESQADLKNSFLYAQNKNNQFECLTFVSTSTLQSYPSQPGHCVRLVYMLTPDPTSPNQYVLQRKEEIKVSEQIDIQNLMSGSFHTLARHIKQCSMEYGFVNLSAEERKNNPNQDWKLAWATSWGDKKQSAPKDDKKEQPYSPQLPDIIRLQLTLQKDANSPAEHATLYFPITTSKESKMKSFAQLRQEKAAKSPTQTQTPTATPVPTPSTQSPVPGQPVWRQPTTPDPLARAKIITSTMAKSSAKIIPLTPVPEL